MLNISVLSKSYSSLNLTKLIAKSFSVSAKLNKDKNVALILCGCGVYDGVEIVEAASAIIHLTKHKANVSFFAPNIEQMHVVNHLTGEVQPEVRNVLIESARIARGNIKSIEHLKAANFDALCIPGGFGAAKNLTNYATQDVKMTVNREIERVVNEFILGSKPIGMCCISPIISAKLLPGCKLTVGKNDKGKQWPYSDTINNLKQLGADVTEKDVNEIEVDEKYKVITTPAFMKNASFYEVFEGIGKMVDRLIKLA